MARTLGSISKNKRGMKARLRAEYGKDFDVIMLMGKNCLALQTMANACQDRLQETLDDKESDIEDVLDHKSGVISSAKVAIDALDKLAQYVEPKLKSIEISGDPENPLEIAAYELTSIERAARLASILEQGRKRRAELSDNGGGGEVDEFAGAADNGGNE